MRWGVFLNGLDVDFNWWPNGLIEQACIVFGNQRRNPTRSALLCVDVQCYLNLFWMGRAIASPWRESHDQISLIGCRHLIPFTLRKKKRYDLNRGHNSKRGFIGQTLIKAAKPQKTLRESIKKVATLRLREVLGMAFCGYRRVLTSGPVCNSQSKYSPVIDARDYSGGRFALWRRYTWMISIGAWLLAIVSWLWIIRVIFSKIEHVCKLVAIQKS